MLYSMAHIDNMTNVNNRRSFDEYMDSAKENTPDEQLVFFSFDLNDLKDANDSYGHEAGVVLIIGAADCMREVLSPFGSVYRTGGDEFAVVALIEPEKRAGIIQKLTDRFALWRGKLYPSPLSISVGYVCADENPNLSLEDMRREAEKRMYAKKADHYMEEGNDRRRARKYN